MSCAAMAPACRAECNYGQCTLHTWPEGATSSPRSPVSQSARSPRKQQALVRAGCARGTKRAHSRESRRCNDELPACAGRIR